MRKTSVLSDFYCLPNKLALMGLRPGLMYNRPSGTEAAGPGGRGLPSLTFYWTVNDRLTACCDPPALSVAFTEIV